MKFVQRMLVGFGGLVLAALLATMAVPKVAHAVVATLVQVSNTTANPAITSNMDNPGRVAYQSTQLGNEGVATLNGFGVDFPPVPPNHRLVVQHVIFQAILTGSGTTMVTLGCDNCGGPIIPLSAFFAPSAQVFGNQNMAAVDSPVLIYFDQYQAPVVQVSNNASIVTNQSSPPAFTLTGYMLDCSAAPCSAIAQ